MQHIGQTRMANARCVRKGGMLLLLVHTISDVYDLKDIGAPRAVFGTRVQRPITRCVMKSSVKRWVITLFMEKMAVVA